MTFDVLIKDGTILDGIANEGRLADVGIASGQIKAVGNLQGARARQTVNAYNKYVSPGFVDIQNHSDSYLTILDIPAQESMVTQGITTIALGHCGTSLAPLSSPEALKSVQKWHSLNGANINWLGFSDYFASLKTYPLGVNVASLAGHSTLRRGLLRDEIRPATPEEVKIMRKMLRDSMTAGAAGLSLGLIYAHEVDASADELAALCEAVAEEKKLLSVHLRSEGQHIAESLNEVLGLAEKVRSRLKISHFKLQGKKNWDYFEEALGTIDRVYQRGVDVFFDVYPYTTSWTVLYTYLPRWAYEGGKASILQNLKNPSNRQRILAHLKGQNENFGEIFIATSETNPAFIGKTLSQIAANQEITVEEAMLNVISATGTQVIVFDHNLSPEYLETLLKHPLSVVSTDGAGYDLGYSSRHGLVHPRCFGSMPKFLSMIREKNLMSWPAAIKKITSRPAEKLGLKKRGVLQEGYFADLVVFDPRTVGSRATYENPYQQPDGIESVVVNGRIAWGTDQPAVASAGQVLRL